jgi:hypothetical protein
MLKALAVLIVGFSFHAFAQGQMTDAQALEVVNAHEANWKVLTDIQGNLLYPAEDGRRYVVKNAGEVLATVADKSNSNLFVGVMADGREFYGYFGCDLELMVCGLDGANKERTLQERVAPVKIQLGREATTQETVEGQIRDLAARYVQYYETYPNYARKMLFAGRNGATFSDVAFVENAQRALADGKQVMDRLQMLTAWSNGNVARDAMAAVEPIVSQLASLQPRLITKVRTK